MRAGCDDCCCVVRKVVEIAKEGLRVEIYAWNLRVGYILIDVKMPRLWILSK